MNETPLDIGADNDNVVSQVLGYYDPTPKATADGLVFRTYFGLRQYYVTGGFDARFLTLTDAKEIQLLSRQHKWNHQWDLTLRLMQVLIHNIRLNPKAMTYIPITAKIVWRKGSSLNRNERAWLKIVKSVNTNR